MSGETVVNSVSAQTIEFLYSALLGLCLGVLFDVVKTARSYAPKKKAVTALFDILFWLVAIVSLCAFTLTVSGGRMRWYVLFGVLAGGFVYTSALSMIVFKVMRASVSAVRKVLSLITRPLYLLLRMIWRGGKKLEHSAENSVRKKVRAARIRKRKGGKNVGKKKKETQGTVP